jgi:hypothetical protein
MKIVEKQITKGAAIALDDTNFVNCEFTECRLMYSGGDFALTDSKLINCQVTLMGPAQRTAALLASMGALKPGGPFQMGVPPAPPSTLQ